MAFKRRLLEGQMKAHYESEMTRLKGEMRNPRIPETSLEHLKQRYATLSELSEPIFFSIYLCARMVVKKAGIQFHRRSRYEGVLELVNDNEDALKPFPNRDAVFSKQSNQGTRCDGEDHLDNLKVQEKQIAERIVRDHMLREICA